MPVQTAYPLNHSAAVVGAVVDGRLKNIRSGVADVAIPFGRFVSRGAADGRCKLPTASGDITATGMGIAARILDDAANASDVAQYEIGRNVSIVDFGTVWVTADENVTAGANAFVRYAAGGQGQGTFGVAAGASERAQLAGAYFEAAGSAGALVPLRLRLINGA